MRAAVHTLFQQSWGGVCMAALEMGNLAIRITKREFLEFMQELIHLPVPLVLLEGRMHQLCREWLVSGSCLGCGIPPMPQTALKDHNVLSKFL